MHLLGKKRKHNLGNPLTFPLQLIQTFTREGLTNTLELKQLFPDISSFSFLSFFVVARKQVSSASVN